MSHGSQLYAPDRLLPLGVVADMLGVSRWTVARLRERGELVPIQISERCTRYRLRDVEALIERRRGEQ